MHTPGAATQQETQPRHTSLVFPYIYKLIFNSFSQDAISQLIDSISLRYHFAGHFPQPIIFSLVLTGMSQGFLWTES